MRSPVWGPASLRGRLALTAASAAAVVVAFVGVCLRFGYEPIALNVLPLVVAGLMFGVRGGIAAWAVLIPLNMLIHLALGRGLVIGMGENPVRVLVGLGLGLVVGRMRDLSLAFEAEASRRTEEFARRVQEADRRELAERQLHLTLAAIPDAMLRLTRDGTVVDGHDGRRGDLPFPVARLRGKPLAETMPAAFVEQVLPALARTLETRKSQVAEYRVLRDGQPLDHEVRLVASGPEEALAIIRDVTEGKRLDELLRLREREQAQARVKERLAAADRHTALGTLAAGVAHEINNPLSYLISNLKFLTQELAPLAAPAPVLSGNDVSQQLQQAAVEALEGAERVRIIVRDLNSFVRADSDATELIDLRAELEFALTMARNELTSRARLVRDIHEVARVRATPARLAQVFLNLLLNAAQAIDEGPPDQNEIRVVVRMDGLEAVVVEIRDTGSGISPEARAHLFDPFFTTKPVGRGTGLGLYVCLNQVTATGGTIELIDASPRGTLARVRVPASPEDGAFAFDRVPGDSARPIPVGGSS